MKPSSDTFNTLWSQMHEPVCWFICSRVSNDEDAEDVLQDVFLRVYDQLETVRDPQRLESWMYQIARNRIIDHYRSQRPWVELSETQAIDEGIEEEETLQSLLPDLREAVATLPEHYREALIRSDLQGISQQDLAGELNITLSGAKSRVQRARQKVKEAIIRCYDLEFDAREQVMNFQARCCC